MYHKSGIATLNFLMRRDTSLKYQIPLNQSTLKLIIFYFSFSALLSQPKGQIYMAIYTLICKIWPLDKRLHSSLEWLGSIVLL